MTRVTLLTGLYPQTPVPLLDAAAERRGDNLKGSRTLSESKGQHLTLTVLYVPYSLDSGDAKPALKGRRGSVQGLCVVPMREKDVVGRVETNIATT
jgi:hypothetical protein